MKKKQFLLILVLFIISLYVVKSDSSSASWTRAYCIYNSGAGGYACDSGNVGGDSASCNAANGVQCAEQGDVYCYGQSNCETQGGSSAGPVNEYNVNWDTDSADCQCIVGAAGRYGLSGDYTTPNCCGDDGSEFYKNNVGVALCCNNNNDCAISGTCITSGNENSGYCCYGSSQTGDCDSDGSSSSCYDDGYISSSTCYYDESCAAGGFTAASQDSCLNAGCDADGVESGGSCYWDEACTTSGRTVGSASCAAGTAVCSDDGVESGGSCYWDESCTGAGYTAPSTADCSSGTASCYDSGYLSGENCYYGEVCTPTGYTSPTIDQGPNAILWSDCDIEGVNPGSYSATDTNAYCFDDSADVCYYDADDACNAIGWNNFAAEGCFDNAEAPGDGYCYWNEGCDSTGCTSSSADCSADGSSTNCYDDPYINAGTCYYDESCTAGGYIASTTAACVAADCGADGLAVGDICHYNEQCTGTGRTAMNDSAPDVLTSWSGCDGGSDNSDSGSAYCYSDEANGYNSPDDTCFYESGADACEPNAPGWNLESGTCRDGGEIIGGSCYFNEGCDGTGCLTQVDNTKPANCGYHTGTCPATSGNDCTYHYGCTGEDCDSSTGWECYNTSMDTNCNTCLDCDNNNQCDTLQADTDGDGVIDACDIEGVNDGTINGNVDTADSGQPVDQECTDGNDNDGDQAEPTGGCDAWADSCGAGIPADPGCSISCSSCADCGEGFFNFCDRIECLNCVGGCYFDSSFYPPTNVPGSCTTCGGATCEDYNDDSLTCVGVDGIDDTDDTYEDPCNLNNCAWDTTNNKCCTDTDGDDICDDGDFSGTVGDNYCKNNPATGLPVNTNCDDNCINTVNSNQNNTDRDDYGNVCETCDYEPALTSPVGGTELFAQCTDTVDNDCDSTSWDIGLLETDREDCENRPGGGGDPDCSANFTVCGGTYKGVCDGSDPNEDWASTNYAQVCDNGALYNYSNSNQCDQRLIADDIFFWNGSLWINQTECESTGVCVDSIYWLENKNNTCCLAGDCITATASCSVNDGCMPNCAVADPDCGAATCVADATDLCQLDCNPIDPDCRTPLYTDDSSIACELFNPSTLQYNCSDGENGCWSPWNPYNPTTNTKCCGDDGDWDTWADGLNNACVNGTYYTEPDDQSFLCEVVGPGTQGACDANGETLCWGVEDDLCCGDDAGESWNYTTSYYLGEVLVNQTCYDGEWYIRDDATSNVTYYELLKA